MKKLAALFMIAALILAAGAYALAEAGLPNPMVEVQDVPAVEGQLGVKMPLPDGARVDKCYVIGDAIGQADYAWESANYSFRAKKGEEFEDISGVYGDYPMAEVVELDQTSVTLFIAGGQPAMAQWYMDGASYALVIEENGTEDALLNVLYEVLYA